MSLEWFLILVDRLDALVDVFAMIIFLGLFVVVITCILYIKSKIDYFSDEELDVLQLSKRLTLVWVIVVVLQLLIPSPKTLYMVWGIHYTKQTIENPHPLLEKSLALLEKRLDELLKDSK